MYLRECFCVCEVPRLAYAVADGITVSSACCACAEHETGTNRKLTCRTVVPPLCTEVSDRHISNRDVGAPGSVTRPRFQHQINLSTALSVQRAPRNPSMALVLSERSSRVTSQICIY
jgi:hypothetical protein